MSRVEIATTAWGQLRNGNDAPLVGGAPSAFTDLAGGAVTIYNAATGVTPYGGAWVSDADGLLPGWVDQGSYKLTEDGVERRVEAASGDSLVSVESDSANAFKKVLATAGQKGYRDTFGLRENAAGLVFIANRSSDPTVQVMGTDDPSGTAERGSVAVMFDNITKAPTVPATTSTTFTATTVTFGGGVDLTNVKAGMIIDAGTKSALVASVAGQVVTISALGWRLASAGTTPPADATSTKINDQNSVWALNANVYSEGAGDTQALIGFELGVKVARDDGGTIALSASEGAGSRGYDAVALSSAGKPLFGYTSRGRFAWGYSASGMIGSAASPGAGFVYHKQHQFTGGSTVSAAFLDDDSNSDVSFRARYAAATDRFLEAWVGAEANPQFRVNGKGDMEWGPGGATAPDVLLGRSAAATLYCSGNFDVDGNLSIDNAWTTNADAAVNGYVLVNVDGVNRKLATIA